MKHELVKLTMHTARCRCGAVAFGLRPMIDAPWMLERFHLSRQLAFRKVQL